MKRIHCLQREIISDCRLPVADINLRSPKSICNLKSKICNSFCLPVLVLLVVGLGAFRIAPELVAQDANKPATGEGTKSAAPAPAPRDTQGSQQYSGTYTFLKEGEFVQLTVEDDGRVTGFISRFGNGENDKGEFLDQFFKSGKLEGNKLSFTTQVVHGVDFDFKGSVERGEGKNPGDEAYFILQGTLTQNTTDTNKKVTAHAQQVAFKLFPKDTAPPAVGRN